MMMKLARLFVLISVLLVAFSLHNSHAATPDHAFPKMSDPNTYQVSRSIDVAGQRETVVYMTYKVCPRPIGYYWVDKDCLVAYTFVNGQFQFAKDMNDARGTYTMYRRGQLPDERIREAEHAIDISNR